MEWVYDDGGRKSAGYKGQADDCVVRSVAIAFGRPYRDVYNELKELMGAWQFRRQFNPFAFGRDKTPREGVPKKIARLYLDSLNCKWTPTMYIGSGCKVHLQPDELPSGRIIAVVSKHLVAVIDGVIHDTADPSRYGKRCVYGYWQIP